jgi:hypothetical protein
MTWLLDLLAHWVHSGLYDEYRISCPHCFRRLLR